jgi:hypothetical protein
MAPDNSKQDWSAGEDMILIEKQSLMGNQWAQIKAFLPGRSLVSVKNRWNWLCRRDIPNHSQEFEEIVRSRSKTEEFVSSPGEFVIPDLGTETQLDPWTDPWPFGLLF